MTTQERLDQYQALPSEAARQTFYESQQEDQRFISLIDLRMGFLECLSKLTETKIGRIMDGCDS